MTAVGSLVVVLQTREPRGINISRLLRTDNHPVQVVHQPSQVAALLRRVDIDLVVANGSGPETVSELSAICQPTSTGLIVLCDPALVDAATALDLGADDYLASPPEPAEFLARLRAVLRRTRRAPPADETVSTASFKIDVANRLATPNNGQPVHLTGVEWRLVEVLVRHPGRLVTTSDLLSQVWGPKAKDKSHYLRIHMASVRRKLELQPSAPRYFVTEPGLGLRFQP